MILPNIQVPPVGMRIPITPNIKATDSVPRKKSQDGRKGGIDMNLQGEIKELKQRIAELEQLAKQEQRFPQLGEEYWYIDNDGEVMEMECREMGFDKGRISIDNVFRTKEDAEFAVEKLKVESELRKLSDSWDLEKTQYTFSFNWEVTEFEIEYPDYNQYPDSYYFDSLNALEIALETVGEDRIKKYIFGVG